MLTCQHVYTYLLNKYKLTPLSSVVPIIIVFNYLLTVTLNMDKIYPVENATVPYWRSELHEIDIYRSTAELPEECDIIIIGAGLSGVSTAHFLLEDNPSPPSVVLLEARQICSGATGRNGNPSLIPDIRLGWRNRRRTSHDGVSLHW